MAEMGTVGRVAPRVICDEAVCLVRVDDGQRVIARCVTVGTDGMSVRAPRAFDLGTELECDVLLPGGPRKLRGRVVSTKALQVDAARLIGAPAGTELEAFALAIVFESLTERDTSVLAELVASRLRGAIDAKVQLPGVAAPVKCRAVVAKDAIHLSTTLPFLRLASDVDVMLPRDGGDVRATGVLSKVVLEPPTPEGVARLSLQVELPPSASASSARAAAIAPEPAPPSRRAVPAPGTPEPLPSVIVSEKLARQVVELDARRRAREGSAAVERAAPARDRTRHETAEVGRRAPFTDWAEPPAIAETPRSTPPRRRPTLLVLSASRMDAWALMLAGAAAALAFLVAVTLLGGAAGRTNPAARTTVTAEQCPAGPADLPAAAAPLRR